MYMYLSWNGKSLDENFVNKLIFKLQSAGGRYNTDEVVQIVQVWWVFC